MRRYDVTNDLFNGVLSGYYDPIKNADGSLNWAATNDYTFRNFNTRYSDIPDVKLWFEHKRKPGTDVFNQPQTTPGTDDSDITALLEQLNLNQ